MTKAARQAMDLERMLHTLEPRFEAQVTEFQRSASPAKERFVDLVLHFQFFCLDLLSTVAALKKSLPGSLVEKMAAAKVIHVLFEFKLTCDGWLVQEMVNAYGEIGAEIDREELRAAKRRFSPEFQQLEKWSAVRNHVTGHHSKDARAMWNALKSIDIATVEVVACAQLEFLLHLVESSTAALRDGD